MTLDEKISFAWGKVGSYVGMVPADGPVTSLGVPYVAIVLLSSANCCMYFNLVRSTHVLLPLPPSLPPSIPPSIPCETFQSDSDERRSTGFP